MASGAARKWAGIAAFLCPVILGLLFMGIASAPAHYLATNAGAALAACLLIAVGRHQNLASISPVIVVAIALALLAATFAGPDVEGVHRWIAIGPVRLHAGLLVLPSLAIILHRIDDRMAFIAAAGAATLIAFQPDRASAFALCAGALTSAAAKRSLWSASAFMVALGALGITMALPDPLDPVPFVENVIADAGKVHPLLSVAMVASVAVAATAPLLGSGRRTSAGLAWSACLIAFSLAALAGHYPTPLLGYGISSIAGLGLALALSAKTAEEKEPAT
jgi:cell division protein FtsW (lipid II flippase)